MSFRYLQVTIGSISMNTVMRPGNNMYLLKNVEEFLSALGSVRKSEAPRQGFHGVETGLSQYPGRLLPFEVEIHAVSFDDRVSMETALERELALPIAQDFDDDGYKLILLTDEDGIEKQIYARIDQTPAYAKFAERSPRSSRCLFTMFAEDPVIYAQELQELTGGESAHATDFTFEDGELPTFEDGELPTFGDSIVFSVTGAQNAGTIGTAPLIIIYGPAESPIVTNATTGKVMDLSHAGGLSLEEDERVEIDVAAFTIKKYDSDDNETNVKANLTPTSRWIFVVPGENDFSLFDDSPGEMEAALEVKFRNSWI